MSSTCPYPWSYPLITGASSGFGAEFARQLAPTAKSIVLTARRASVLESLAENQKVSRICGRSWSQSPCC